MGEKWDSDELSGLSGRGDPSAWPCPTCGALPEGKCRTPGGKLYPHYTHSTRNRLSWPRSTEVQQYDYPRGTR